MKVNQKAIILDVETGGFSPLKNPITQISLIVIDTFELKELERFDCYIQPYDDSLYMTKDAIKLTRITKEKCIAEGISLEDAVNKLVEIFKRHKVSYYVPQLIGHNLVGFDIYYLMDIFDRVFGEGTGKDGRNKLFDFIQIGADTMLLARQKFINNEVSDFKLNTLAAYTGFVNRHAHDSMADVETTLELYKYFISCLRGDGNYQSSNQESFNYQF